VGRWASRGKVELRNDEHRILAVNDFRELATSPGQVLSLMPLGRCGRVWTLGLRWELGGEPLDLAERTSVSNVAEGRRVELRVDGGTLLVFLSEPVTS